MSVLSVWCVPAGILIGADRNVTVRSEFDGGRGVTVEQVGQAQYPKVLEWPDGRAIMGYFGFAKLGSEYTHRWLHHFIGRNMQGQTIADIAERLADDLNADMPSDEKRKEPLIVHLAGFDLVDGERAPVVWFIHNTGGLDTYGYYTMPGPGMFAASEELRALPPPARFHGLGADAIRDLLDGLAAGWEPFWFKQGADLGAFNALDAGIRLSMSSIVTTHPRQLHPVPSTCAEWAQHLRLAILTYGAYFQAFYPAWEQLVVGGADVVWIRWPETP